MSDLVVRPVAESERRAVQLVVANALHFSPATDEEWERDAETFPAERKLGAFDGTTLIGTTSSFASALAVPGGGTVPAAAVEAVGVQPGYTRRGVLTRLMTEQLRDCARRGDAVAVLHASETTSYGRFGYGIATRAVRLRVDRRRARLRPDLPTAGTVRLLDVPAALAGRGYGRADPVVLAVSDSRLPNNTGHYRISPDGVTRTGESAQLSLSVDTLAMLYLGEWTPSALAGVGRITSADPSALARADELFRTPVRPWCGTSF